MFTNEALLEGWLGTEAFAGLCKAAESLTTPVPVLNVPGDIYACKGLFRGAIRGGAFSSLSDLIAERTAGKGQDLMFFKIGGTKVVGGHYSLWNSISIPVAGGIPAARPGGAVPTNVTPGSLPVVNAAGGDTLHFTTGWALASVSANTLLLYDRLFHASAILHNTSAAQTVTGVPTRYQGAAAVGNFAFLEVRVVLTATGFNITLQYVDKDGNAAENAIVTAGIVSSAVGRLPHAAFAIPLNGDAGLRNVTQVTLSAAAASGESNLVIGHPLALLPCPVANTMFVADGINSAFNLAQIVDNACLAFLEIAAGGTGTTSYAGEILVVSG